MDELWLDRFARYLGFGWLAERLPGDLPPSYLYAFTAVVVSNVVLTSYDLLNRIPLIYEENPYFLLLPVLMLGAVYGSRSLRRSYAGVMDEMMIERRASDPGALVDIVPPWLPWALFVLGAGLQLVRSVLNLDALVVPTGVIKNFVVFPFIYAPIVAQFFAVYLAIECIAPLWLTRSDVGIHFLDPEGVGGLRPLGELIKKAYYYVVVGLIAGALITYAPFVSSEWAVIPFVNVLFTGIWIVSVATVGFAVLMLHRFMHWEKRAEKRRLEAELLEYIDDPWDIKEHEIPEGSHEEVEEIRRRLDRVSATNEYPATFNIWSQLMVSILVPKAVQMLLANACC